MSSKNILLSYLDRKRVVKVPCSHSCTSDIAYLESKFWKLFHFGSNVHVTVTFQKCDSSWNEFIDLEEDATLEDKEKLKVIVTPMLTTLSPSAATAMLPSEVCVH